MDRLNKTALLTILYVLFIIYGGLAQEFILDKRFGKLTVYSPEEVRNLKHLFKLCIFGSDDDPGLAQVFSHQGAATKVLPGGHHFNNDFNSIVNLTMRID